MKSFLDAIQNGRFEKTVWINISELLDSGIGNLQAALQGNCRTNTLIHVNGLTLAFTTRAAVQYEPNKPVSTKFVFDYTADHFNDWKVEKVHCTPSLNLNDPDVQKAITYLLNNGKLEYNVKDEDALALQIIQHQSENTKEPSVLTTSPKEFESVGLLLSSPIFRDMDQFFS